MQFEESQRAKKIGVAVGYACSYAVFTAMLYGLLFVLKRLPETWSYFHIMAITASVAALGGLIRWLLK